MLKSCPCSSGKSYESCCGRYIQGNAYPETPEELMRSRYTAYTQANIDYISRTMIGPATKNFDPQSSKKWAQSVEWVKLDVLRSSIESSKGWVEFIAHFIEDGRKHILHENSEFHLIEDRWYYVSGITPNVNRNDLCPCGSGKKYKKCCRV